MAKTMNVGRLSISMVADTVEYVNKLKDAEKKTEVSLNKMMRDYKKTAAQTEKTGKKINNLSQRLKDMSQSAALVTGPLGGIASRLTILSSVVAAGPLVGAVVALSTALAGMYQILRSGIMTTDETITQLSQLEAQLKLTGDVIGFTVKDLDSFARELGLATLTSTREAREAMSVLATTTSLTGDAFKRTTKLAQDITQVFGGTLKSNAKLLAKALEDPADGVEKLERLNIRLTDAQKKQVEQMVAAGDIYSAQSLILDQVAKKYENIASSISSETIAVQADEMSQRWDELTEAISGTMDTQPKVVAFMKDINKWLTGLTGFFNEDFVIDLESQKKAAEDIKMIFGDVNSILTDSDAELDLIKDISGTYANIQDLESALNALESAYEGNKFFDGKSFASKIPNIGLMAKGLGLLEDKLAGNQLKTVLDNTKKELSYQKALQEQMITLHRASLTERNNISIRKQEEARKVLEKNEANLVSLMDLPEVGGDFKKSLSEPFEYLASMLQSLDLSDVSALDISMMTPEAISDLESMLAEAEGVMDAFSQEHNQDFLDFTRTRLEEQKILELEAAAGMMGAKNKLLANKYAEDLANYRDYIKGKADEYTKLKQYEMQMATQFGEQMFQQQVEARQKETAWLTDSLTTVQGAMESLGKEGSSAAKAMFLVNQGIMFANAVMSAQSAAAAAKAQAYAMLLPAPAAEAAGTAALMSGMLNAASIAATTIAGVAHGGMDSVPSESTFLLQKGERVVQPKANEDLTKFLRNPDTSGGVSISAPMTIQGNVTDEKWFNMQLYNHRQMILAMNNRAKREKPRR